MTVDQMKRGIELSAGADHLRTQLDTFVLLKADSYTKEVVCLGEPRKWEKDSYNRVEVRLTDDLRRYAFRVWKRDQTIRYNEIVRELNQLGVVTGHTQREVPRP